MSLQWLSKKQTNLLQASVWLFVLLKKMTSGKKTAILIRRDCLPWLLSGDMVIQDQHDFLCLNGTMREMLCKDKTDFCKRQLLVERFREIKKRMMSR
jgi:hypothetical protein